MNNCNHMTWVYPQDEQDDYTGEWYRPEPYQQSTQEDLDVGRFKCSRCGEIGYYTGLWKRYFEEGIPCPGSERYEGNK